MRHKREAKITSPVISLGDDSYRLMSVAAFVGVVGLVAALAIAFVQSPTESFKRLSYAYLVNFCFFATIALGALFFVTVQHLTRAGWSVTVRRIAEILAAAIVPLFVLFLPILIPVILGYGGLYRWNDAGWTAEYAGKPLTALESLKAAYLSSGFYGVRTIVYFAIWSLMAWFFVGNSLRQDATGDVKLTSRMQAFSAPMTILFAVCLVFASFDWEMSLEPMWFSTMFPVCFFAGCVIGGCAAIALISLLLQRSGRVTDEITIDNIHDLGKLMFAFTFFWGYVEFGQFMLIWYANIPEETFWFKFRSENNGWLVVSTILLVFHLFVPFLALLPRTLKRNRAYMIGMCCFVLLMHWVDHYWVIMPQMQKYGQPSPPVFGFVEVLCFVGLGGLFIASFCFIASDRPLVPLKDPRLGEALNYTNY
jgi:hypothetical protein